MQQRLQHTSWTIGNQCLIGGVCYTPGAKAPGNCQECNPTASKTSWTPLATSCVIDGSCYVSGGTHPSATCNAYGVTCNPNQSTTAWTVAGDGCVINGQCYANGALNPANACMQCNTATSKTAWSPTSNNCAINGSCYANAAAHPSATCSAYGVTCSTASSTTTWTVSGDGCAIGNQCYANGALDPTGCYKCDTAMSKTAWTPQGTCTNIIMAALNEGHQGNLGGTAGADALCAQQALAAGHGGTWKAFLSSPTQNVKDLVTGAGATNLPVVNLKGENMWANWNTIFTQGTWNGTAQYIWSFSGKYVDEGQASPDWSDADGWHGSLSTGAASANTCNNWTDNTGVYLGANGEWDFGYMFTANENQSCSRYHAVACVRLP